MGNKRREAWQHHLDAIAHTTDATPNDYSQATTALKGSATELLQNELMRVQTPLCHIDQVLIGLGGKLIILGNSDLEDSSKKEVWEGPIMEACVLEPCLRADRIEHLQITNDADSDIAACVYRNGDDPWRVVWLGNDPDDPIWDFEINTKELGLDDRVKIEKAWFWTRSDCQGNWYHTTALWIHDEEKGRLVVYEDTNSSANVTQLLKQEENHLNHMLVMKIVDGYPIIQVGVHPADFTRYSLHYEDQKLPLDTYLNNSVHINEHGQLSAVVNMGGREKCLLVAGQRLGQKLTPDGHGPDSYRATVAHGSNPPRLYYATTRGPEGFLCRFQNEPEVFGKIITDVAWVAETDDGDVIVSNPNIRLGFVVYSADGKPCKYETIPAYSDPDVQNHVRLDQAVGRVLIVMQDRIYWPSIEQLKKGRFFPCDSHGFQMKQVIPLTDLDDALWAVKPIKRGQISVFRWIASDFDVQRVAIGIG